MPKLTFEEETAGLDVFLPHEITGLCWLNSNFLVFHFLDGKMWNYFLC